MNVTFVHQGSYSNQGGLWASDSDNRIGLTDQQAKAVDDKVNKM